nr:hypothetical protein [Tanacetum cinerariifolium]
MYMAKVQEVSPDAVDSEPIFDTELDQKVLVDKLKSEIEDFKNKNKSLELSYNQSKEANNKLSKENDLMYADYEKSQEELARRNTESNGTMIITIQGNLIKGKAIVCKL